MTKVKICGLTNLEDARVAVEAGADLIGFIFYEPSPRYVAPETVRKIVDQLSESSDAHPIFVGVFVNEAMERVQHIVDYCRLDAVQLHGDESPQDVARFKGQAYKVLRPQSQEEADDLVERFTQSPNSEFLPAVMIEAYHPTLYGGTGHLADWNMAANIARQYPIMLAGSLTPTNVVEAIEAVAPWGVDVSSGVEAQKGKKDHQKVRAFIEAVRNREGGLL